MNSWPGRKQVKQIFLFIIDIMPWVAFWPVILIFQALITFSRKINATTIFVVFPQIFTFSFYSDTILIEWFKTDWILRRPIEQATRKSLNYNR